MTSTASKKNNQDYVVPGGATQVSENYFFNQISVNIDEKTSRWPL